MVLHAIPTKEKAKREIHVLFLQRNYHECAIQGSQQDSCLGPEKSLLPALVSCYRPGFLAFFTSRN